MKNKIVFVILLLFVLIALAFTIFDNNNEIGFESNSLFLKLNVKENNNLTWKLEISNLFLKSNKFSIETNLDFLTFNEYNPIININEKKEITLFFDIKDKKPGTYTGKIIISNDKELIIPIILEIETNEVLFDSIINIPIDQDKIISDKYLNIENKIFDLENSGKSNIIVEYKIKDFDNNLIYSDKDNIIINNQMIISKTIPIHDKIKKGDYVFISEINHKDSLGISTYIFKITDKKLFDFSRTNMNLLIFAILFSLIIYILYYLKKRDKILLELKKGYNKQLRLESKKYSSNKSKLINLNNKTKIKKLNSNYRKRQKIIYKIYRTRIKEIKKLKKNKRKSQIQEKIDQWKNEGYNVDEFLLKNEKINHQNKAKEFKKQGYKI